MNSISPTDGENSSKKGTRGLYFDVSYSVLTKDKEKKFLVQNVSDLVQSGEMLAIMGPSGAGKTTLLRVLTMDAHAGEATGQVCFSGHPMTAEFFKTKCGIVNQEDNHWTFLTCRETISYACDLLMNASPADKLTKTNELISKMGLDSCADTFVGNAFVPGLSGGQKRRLSIAVSLIKKLELIFLDEPTSSLDAAAAAGIMDFISTITKQDNLVTVFTVHQPSTAIFNLFDRVMLLTMGRLAFVGAGNEIAAYLQSVGRPLPAQTNPAEFMLDIVNRDFNDETEVLRILDCWDQQGNVAHKKEMSKISALLKEKLANGEVTSIEPDRISLLAQTVVMLKRQSLLAVRDPIQFTGRMIIFIFCTIFFAIIYIAARDRDQDQALQRLWFLVWISGVPSNMGLIGVYVYNVEFLAINREMKAGMVNVLTYLFSNAIMQVPIMFMFALCSIGISAYGILDFTPEHFGQILLIYALTMYMFETIAQVLAVAFANPLIGMLQFISFWFASFLFCGLFLAIDDIVWPFRIFSYVTPYRYSFRAIAYEEYIDSTWNGAELCDPTSNGCTAIPGRDGVNDGFKCSKEGPCYGKEGWQILETLSQEYDLISGDEDNFALDVGVLLALAVGCKIAYMIFMASKSNKFSSMSSDVAASSHGSYQAVAKTDVEDGELEDKQ